MYDLDRVESQLYSGTKISKLLRKLMELWHFQTFRDKKLNSEKMGVLILKISI